MKVSSINGMGSYGVYIDDVDFENLTDEEWKEIGHIHLKNLVTIIRNCNLSSKKQLQWMKKFGNPKHGIFYRMMKKYGTSSLRELAHLSHDDSNLMDPEDKIVMKEHSRVRARVSAIKDDKGRPMGLFDEGELLWHSNEGGTLAFTPGVALLGEKCMVGSSTGFLQTADYYESVSDSFRSELDEMVLTHRYMPGLINPRLDDELGRSNMCPVDDVEIPMVITSPGGIKGLHYPLNTAYGICGMTKAEADKVFEEVNKYLLTDQYIFDHKYQSDNDLMLFDNSITLHRRLDSVPGRLAYRIQHDYSEIQDGFWQPYSQELFAEKYREESEDMAKTLGLSSLNLYQAS
ncbi:TauD/TfdA dioxygenase family protein [Amphritea sp.]|uniref:TauD/TfdA dioxygenase family protein n=1 Tax=Amphritea sp. TaxID=1872502 RepID=UPI003D118BA6